MKLTCPACGAQISLDQAGQAAELVALARAGQAFGEDWPLVSEYLNCFRRRADGALAVKKRLRLAREVYQMWQGGHFAFERQEYRVSRAGLREGLTQAVNRELVGLANHNYLKKILMETAKEESRDGERELRRREERLMGGARGAEPVGRASPPAIAAGRPDPLESLSPADLDKYQRLLATTLDMTRKSEERQQARRGMAELLKKLKGKR